MATEETARLATRIDGIEQSLMVQSGALAAAKDQAEAHREEIAAMMKNLHDTVVHMGSLKENVEKPVTRVPPGFQGADLQVTPTKKEEGAEDPWQATAGRSSADPWANRAARERGARQPPADDKAKEVTEEQKAEDLLLRTFQELVQRASGQPAERTRTEPKKYLEEQTFKRMETVANKDDWTDWSIVFKATARSASDAVFQIIEWVEHQGSPISEDNVREKFYGVNTDKASGELYNLLCMLCKGEALSIVKSESAMLGFAAWQKLHLGFTPRTLARAMMSMVEAIAPTKITHLEDFEIAVGAWDGKLRILERDFDERISPKMRITILTSMCPVYIQDWIYQQGEALGDFTGMVEKLRALVKNRLTLAPQKPFLGAIEEYCGECEQPEEWHGEMAVVLNIACHKCGGVGHYARDCPTQGKGKGDVSGKFPLVSNSSSPKGGGKGDKGKGKGYQRTCFKCGKVGHKAAECRSDAMGSERRAYEVEEVEEEEQTKEVGGVWLIAHVTAKTEAPKKIRLNNRFQASEDEGMEEAVDAQGMGAC